MSPSRATADVTVLLAGFAVAVYDVGTGRAAALAGRYEGWLTSAPPAFSLVVGTHDDLEPADPPTGEWHDRTLRLRAPTFAAALCPAEATGRLRFFAEPAPWDWDALLRNVATLLVLDADGLVFHAAALDTAAGAAVFVGRSGAGKTTTARRLAPVPVLSDEYAFLRLRPGEETPLAGTPAATPPRPACRPLLFPTPAWGHMQDTLLSREPRDVAAVYLLDQAPASEFRRLARTEAAARLAQLPAFACADLPWEEALLARLETLLAMVPCWELRLAATGPIVLPHLARGEV